MSRLLSCVRWFVLLALPIMAYAEEELPPGPNLCQNPGFENVDEAGKALGWSVDGRVFTLSDDTPHAGDRCLRFENADADRYVLCGMPVPLKPGLMYEYGVWVRTEDIQGKDTGTTICLEWYDKDKKYLGGNYTAGIKGTNKEWRYVRGTTGTVPDKAVGCSVTCYVRKRMTGIAWFDDVSVRRHYPPILGQMTTDCYRHEVGGDAITVHAAVSLAGHKMSRDRLKLQLVLSGNGVERTLSPSEELEDSVAFTIDTSGLRPGVYQATCRATIAGKTHERTITLTRVAKTTPRKVFIDRHGRCIVEGKPFFPLGMYWGSVNEKHLDIYAKSAFNCLMPYGRPSREQMDGIQRRGLKVIYSIKDFYAGTKWCPKFIKNREDERPQVEKVVRQFKDHPALLAWYLNDELPWTMIDRLAAHQSWIEELDPDHPTWVVLYQVERVRSYLSSFDVIGTDPYPIPRKPAGTALDWVQRTRKGTFGCHAAWQVPQVFDWSTYKKPAEGEMPYRPPTLLEMRSMAWQSVIGGANGLVFYSWLDLWKVDRTEPFEKRWPEVSAMAAEVARYIPVLLSVEETSQPVTTRLPENVVWRLHRIGDEHILFIVNAGDEPTRGCLRFANPFGAATTEVGDTPAMLKGNWVEMTFAPLETKVVRLSAK